MQSRFTSTSITQLGRICIGLLLLAVPMYGQSDSEVNLKGAIDFHVHAAPDSVDRTIDADDLVRMAKKMGMRGMVLKNHYEDTAALAYMMRKAVPGIELFGGITQDLSNGGVCLESVEHMVAMKGNWGRVIWLPTFDSEYGVKRARTVEPAPKGSASTYNGSDRSCGGATREEGTGPFARVSENGHLVPSVLELIDYIAKNHQLVLETGHSSPEEILMVIHEAHARGVTHIVVTHALAQGMTIPQMQEAGQGGAFLEFTYLSTFGRDQADRARLLKQYADAMRAVGPKYCILATDVGAVTKPPGVQAPLEPQSMLDFMVEMHKQGISVADINLMAKTNPALALGLQP